MLREKKSVLAPRSVDGSIEASFKCSIGVERILAVRRSCLLQLFFKYTSICGGVKSPNIHYTPPRYPTPPPAPSPAPTAGNSSSNPRTRGTAGLSTASAPSHGSLRPRRSAIATWEGWGRTSWPRESHGSFDGGSHENGIAMTRRLGSVWTGIGELQALRRLGGGRDGERKKRARLGAFGRAWLAGKFGAGS